MVGDPQPPWSNGLTECFTSKSVTNTIAPCLGQLGSLTRVVSPGAPQRHSNPLAQTAESLYCTQRQAESAPQQYQVISLLFSDGRFPPLFLSLFLRQILLQTTQMLAAKIIGDLGSISVGLIYVFFAVGMYNDYNAPSFHFTALPPKKKKRLCSSICYIRVYCAHSGKPQRMRFCAHQYLQPESAAAPLGGCIYAVCVGAKRHTPRTP